MRRSVPLPYWKGGILYTSEHAGEEREGIFPAPLWSECISRCRCQKITVNLIDWEHPDKNQFYIAEEVTINSSTPDSFTKRPDLVIYVNGIALAVIELKRSKVSVHDGIRQTIGNQQENFIRPFFSTVQLLLPATIVRAYIMA